MNRPLLSTCTYLSLLISLVSVLPQQLPAHPGPKNVDNTTTLTGTYLKLNVTPDESTENPEAQTQLCTKYFRSQFANSPHNAIIKQSKGFIEVYVDTTNAKEIEAISQTLTNRFKLSIHLVHRDTHTLADNVATKERSIPGFIVLPHIDSNPNSGETTTTQILIRKKAELTEKDVKLGYINPQDYSMIQIELTDTGEKKMEEFTTPLTSRLDMIATIINGKVVNYATLNTNKLGKRFVITGIDSLEKGRQIIQSLRNPLQSTLKITQQRTFKTHFLPQPYPLASA